MQTSISCSKCKLDHTVTDVESGELVCNVCGIVVEDKMEENKVQLKSKSIGGDGRTPSSLASYNMGLGSTMTGITTKDGKGKTMEPFVQSNVKRLRTWDHRIQLHKSKYRSMKRAFLVLDALKDKLNLSDMTIEKAAYIYRKALTKGFSNGRSADAVVTAAAYVAMRETRSPISLKEVANISNFRLNTIARIVRLLVSEFDFYIPTADPYRCVTKAGNLAGLSEKTIREAVGLMSKIKNSEYHEGKRPMSLAAVVLYLACNKTGEIISQKKLAKATGVTEVTIRSRLLELKAKSLVIE
jgi:transcription initiation factor TFIIB